MAARFPELFEFFQQQNFPRRYEKGELICDQGSAFEYVYMVNSGMVKAYDLDETGAERTIAIYSHYNVFPLTGLLEDPPANHLYYFDAFTDTTVFMATKRALAEFTRRHPQVLHKTVDGLVKAYLNLAARVRNLERSRVNERVEFVLQNLAEGLGTFNGDVSDIAADITQEDISRLAGVTRESASLALGAAKSRGLLWKDNHRTYIDMGKLRGQELPTFYEHGAAEVEAGLDT